LSEQTEKQWDFRDAHQGNSRASLKVTPKFWSVSQLPDLWEI
jgi:hypothetical protein